MARASVGLGSNLGDRAAHLFSGLEGCASHGLRLVGLSPLYETAPIGGPSGQRWHLNAVAVFETGLDPRVLLRILQEVEAREGRDRSIPSGPRTLDLDLLLVGEQRRDEAAFTLPHPRLVDRLFALVPLADVEPRALVPGTGCTVFECLRALLARTERPEEVIRPYDPMRT